MNVSRILRISMLLALIAAILTAGGVDPVAATSPSIAAVPTTVPFSPVPGQAGTTRITTTAGDLAGYSVCVSDNGKAPTLIRNVNGQSDASFDFPFIQAGTYRFFVAATPDCLSPSGTAVATVQRAGPNGVVGADDLRLTPSGDIAITLATTFPIGGQICIMSGDGQAKGLNLLFGQDPRPILPADYDPPGLGARAVDTTITGAVVGQNGCYPFNAINNGYYRASFGTAAPQFAGFCVFPVNEGPNLFPPSCLQIVTSPASNPVPPGTTVEGVVVTGISAHAVQVCFSAYSTNGDTVVTQQPPTANAYNATGAVRLTPLTLSYPIGTLALFDVYDITNPDQPGGMNGKQFACPPVTLTVHSGTIVYAAAAPVPNASKVAGGGFIIG